jgi:hypothetical protein
MRMNIQLAILPHKHVRFSESIIALAGLVRRLLIEPRSLDEIEVLVRVEQSRWPYAPSFTEIVLAVDVLFAIGQVRGLPQGRIERVGA